MWVEYSCLVMLKLGCLLFFVTSISYWIMRQVVRKKIARGWDPEYTRRMFFPHWRSVLGARCLMRLCPSYAPAAEFNKALRTSVGRTQQQASSYQPRRPFGTAAFRGNGSSCRNPNHNLLLERIRGPKSNHHSMRLFGTAAAFTLSKLLKNAWGIPIDVTCEYWFFIGCFWTFSSYTNGRKELLWCT